MFKKWLGFLVAILYILTLVSAQDIAATITNILPSLTGVIFILVFILILLIIGGVIKKPAGGIPWSSIFFVLLIIALFIIPQFVPYPVNLEVPQNFKIYPLPSYAASVFEMLGLPSEWMYIPAIIYLFILPFAAIYTLAWAFLQSLGIFENVPASVNRVLAFIIAFLTIPIGWFIKIVWVLFSFMGIWSVVIFGATFIAGIFFRGYGTVRKEYVLRLKTYESIGKELVDELTELKRRVDGLIGPDIDREVGRLAEKYGSIYRELKEDLAARVLATGDVGEKRNIVKEFKLGGKKEGR
jgi:MFS family permease